MQDSAVCSFGGIGFQVHGDSKMVQYFRNEFRADRTGDSAVDFFFHSDSQEFYAQALRSQTPLEFSNFIGDYSISFGERTIVAVLLKRTVKMMAGERMPAIIQRMMTKRFVTASEQLYLHVLYGAVIWMLFLVGMRDRKVILHASGYRSNGGAVLLSGPGGVGKTSLSGWLLRNEHRQFVADDYVVATINGQLYPNPMHIHVYPYNHAGIDIEHVLDSQAIGPLNHLHWKTRRLLLGRKGVCRRISPEALHGCQSDQSEAAVDIDTIVMLSRAKGAPPTTEVGTAQQFAEEHLRVLKHEMRGAFRFCDHIRETGQPSSANGLPEDLETRVADLLYALGQRVSVKHFAMALEQPVEQNGSALVQALSRSHGDGR
jgi:hypothetical protein